MNKTNDCQLNYSYTKTEKDLVIQYSGNISIYHLENIWSESLALIRRYHPQKVSIDLDNLESYDNALIHLLTKLKVLQEKQQRQFMFKSNAYPIIDLFNLYENIEDETLEEKTHELGFFETIGMAVISFYQILLQSFTFIGELILKSINLKKFFKFFLKELCESGPKGLFIVALMGFILGVILSFQGILVLSVFGVQVYVVNMVVIALTREIAPLMTAFIVAGRSVAAFAAEIGSMNVNQEIDALKTMKIDKTSFLIVPKVFSVICTIPLLNLYMLFFGFLGCGLVFMSLGYSAQFFYVQLSQALVLKDLFGGLLKVMVFGAIISSIGCGYGLKAKRGASSVGMATTKSVVMSIIMIIIADGIFSVLFYKLGI